MIASTGSAKAYIKLGHSTTDPQIEPTRYAIQDIREWYKTKASQQIHDYLLTAFHKAFKGMVRLICVAS